MLGRRRPREGVGGRSRQKEKKRKWQESDDDDAKSEEPVTAAEMEEWRKRNADEERKEQLERERQERENEESRRREAERVERQRKAREAEERAAQLEIEEAQKAAAKEREAQPSVSPPRGLSPQPPLGLDILDSGLPPGVHPGKEHLYKTSYCKRWEQGNCNFGSACHFAHGERELRGKPPKGSPAGTLSVQLASGRAPPSARTLVSAPVPGFATPGAWVPPPMQSPGPGLAGPVGPVGNIPAAWPPHFGGPLGPAAAAGGPTAPGAGRWWPGPTVVPPPGINRAAAPAPALTEVWRHPTAIQQGAGGPQTPSGGAPPGTPVTQEQRAAAAFMRSAMGGQQNQAPANSDV